MTRDDSTIKLANNWTVLRVSKCLSGGQKEELIRFLRERYTERFFDPIAQMTQAPSTGGGYGFAIMSLCCLLIETIECYRLGWPSSHVGELRQLESSPSNLAVPEPHYKLQGPFNKKTISSEVAFDRFFQEPKHQPYFPCVDGKIFYRKIRCGLLHQAQTKGGWRIVRSGKYWDDRPDELTVNRDEFSGRLKDCFDAFGGELDTAGWGEDLWKNVQKKIWWLA